MSYIPIVPHVPQPKPSPRVRRLAVELEGTLERFEQEQGELDSDELREALGIVASSVDADTDPDCNRHRLRRVSWIGAALVVGACLVIARSGLALGGRTWLALGAVLSVGIIAAIVATTSSRN